VDHEVTPKAQQYGAQRHLSARGAKKLANDNLPHKVFIQEIGLQVALKLKDLQKFLDKVNFLRRFISNLFGKIDTFTSILRLKDETEFTWGGKTARDI